MSSLMSGNNLVKIGIWILGFLCLTLGTYSHFRSDWRRHNLNEICSQCTSHNSTDFNIFRESSTCPKIGCEIFYVVVVTCGFAISTAFILIQTWPKVYQRTVVRLMDFGCHAIFSLLLLSSSCTFIWSAAKIDQLIESGEVDKCFHGFDQFLIGGKIVAGVIGLKLGVLYGVHAYIRLRENSGKDEDYQYIVAD